MSQLVQTCLAAAAAAEARLIGQDLVRRPRWAWMEGMLAEHKTWGRLRIVAVLGNGARVARPFGSDDGASGSFVHSKTLRHCWPDLTDPATLGCLQELVRRAHQATTVSVVFSLSLRATPDEQPPPFSAFAQRSSQGDRRLSVGRSVMEALALALTSD